MLTTGTDTLKAGAAGYLMMDSEPTELIGAVRKVVTGGRYLTPAVAERLAGYLAADSDKPPHENLSDREYQIMWLIASGNVSGMSDRTTPRLKCTSAESGEARRAAW